MKHPRLHWTKHADSMNMFRAETARHRFILVAPPRAKVSLWVQPASADWGTEPIDSRSCRSRRGAVRIAQRFANAPRARRLV